MYKGSPNAKRENRVIILALTPISFRTNDIGFLERMFLKGIEEDSNLVDKILLAYQNEEKLDCPKTPVSFFVRSLRGRFD